MTTTDTFIFMGTQGDMSPAEINRQLEIPDGEDMRKHAFALHCKVEYLNVAQMFAMADYLLNEFFNKKVATFVATARDFTTAAEYLEHVRIASLVDERRHYDALNAQSDKAMEERHDRSLIQLISNH